jgi:hypothetical protein
VLTNRVIAAAGLLLLAMGGCAWIAFTKTWWAAPVLILLSVLWLVLQMPFEGPVLVTLVRYRHGIVASDLVAVVGLLLAGAALIRPR